MIEIALFGYLICYLLPIVLFLMLAGEIITWNLRTNPGRFWGWLRRVLRWPVRFYW